RLPPRPPPLPYTTLFRSGGEGRGLEPAEHEDEVDGRDEEDKRDTEELDDRRAGLVERCPRLETVAKPTGPGERLAPGTVDEATRSEEHTSELQSRENLVC